VLWRRNIRYLYLGCKSCRYSTVVLGIMLVTNIRVRSIGCLFQYGYTSLVYSRIMTKDIDDIVPGLCGMEYRLRVYSFGDVCTCVHSNEIGTTVPSLTHVQTSKPTFPPSAPR